MSKDGFSLESDEKVSYSEVKKLGGTIVSPHKLDAREAARIFDEVRQRKVSAAEGQLHQMQEVKKQFEAKVAQWKAQPLPGAQMEDTLTEFRRWAGIRKATP